MGTAQQYCLRWNNHRSNLLTVFDELLQNEAFTDVTLSCEGGKLKCHKMVLAACSPYFQNLFTDLPCKHPVVVLKDVKYSEIKAILEYMYRGEVNVAQDQLAALLKVAETLKVKGLVEERCPPSNSATHVKQEEEELPMQHSSPSISTSGLGKIQAAAHSSSNGSPPHSTNGLHYKNPYTYSSKSSPSSSSSERSPGLNLSMWPTHGLPLTHHSSSIPSQSHPHPAATAAAAMLSSCYKAGSDMSPLKRKKLSSLLMNRDTPILRTVLGQGQESLAGNSRSYDTNESDQLEMEKHMKNEPSEDAHSPYTDPTTMEDEEKSKMGISSISPPSFSGDARSMASGIAPYVPPQRPEWRRYKQYTPTVIMAAIEAVRNGMSALKASKHYNVPSRTLYDKVKKLGIKSRPCNKRISNGNRPRFPYGLSDPRSPYGGNLSETEESAMNNNSTFLEASAFLQHALEGCGDERDALEAMASRFHQIHVSGQNRMSPPGPGNEYHHSETNGNLEREQDDDDDQVEDLSMGRKQETGVIMPPMNQVSTIIKNEEMLKDAIREEMRREVSVEETE